MYLPFNHLPKFPKLANFESFRKMTTHLYTILNRLVSGKTYVDLFSAQSIATPLLDITDNIAIPKNLSYDSIAHVVSKINPSLLTGTSSNDLVTGTNHDFLNGMPLVYNTDGTTISNLYNNRVYWTNSANGTSFSLSEVYGGQIVPITDFPAGNHTFKFAYPFTQIKESFLTPRNNTYPTPQAGNLAYGDIYQGTKAQWYYKNSSGNYKQVKLGWNGGNGYYNNDSTFAQKHTSWCHGIGKYKIVTASNQIKITFDAMEVREPITGARDVVISKKTVPTSNYSVLVRNSSAGLNSIDSGVILSNSGYYIFLLYCPEDETYGAVLSLSHDMPTVFYTNPNTGTQYRYYQRLGWIRTDNDGAFFTSLQIGKELLFFQKPPNNVDIAFYSGGTSIATELYSRTEKISDKYPYLGYVASTDIYLNWTGTGFNRNMNNNRRVISLNEVPTYELSVTASTSSQYFPVNYVLNDFVLPINTNSTITVAHPDDTGGTDFSNFGVAFTGFRFNGELYV